MSKVVLTGDDILTINDRVLSDFAEGAVAVLEFPNDLTSMNVGKNGNAIITLNEMGKVANLTLRVLVGSADDIYFNSLLSLLKKGLPYFPLMYGQFVKILGDGSGNVYKSTFNLINGVFTVQPGTSEDKSGAVDQAVSVWTIAFSDAPRTIGQ